MLFFRRKINNRGSILLLAMLIMSGSIVTGLAIGNIVLNEIRQSRNIDDAITAYYAAESGLEQTIFLYRKDNATFVTQIDEIPIGDPPPGSPSDCYFNMSNFNNNDCVVYAQEATIQNFTILPNTVQQINLFNDNLAVGFDVNSMVVTWSDANPGNGVEPWLEMAVIELEPNFLTRDPVIFIQTCGAGPVCTPIDGANYAVASNYFDTNKNYQVRFRALYDTIDVRVTTYDGASGSGDVTGSRAINIFTTGGFRTSKQSMRAQLSTGATTTKPFVDFVIFSECDLVKGFGLPSNCP